MVQPFNSFINAPSISYRLYFYPGERGGDATEVCAPGQGEGGRAQGLGERAPQSLRQDEGRVKSHGLVQGQGCQG